MFKEMLKKFGLVAIIVTSLFFVACGSSSDPEPGAAVVATVASDYSSGATSLVTDGDPAEVQNGLNALTHSDHVIDVHGSFFYDIERLNHDAITKFSKDNPKKPVWNYSTMDDDDKTEGITSSNPHQIAVKDDKKAYLIRYGSKRSWIVDPSAKDQASFKIGELDLSKYIKDTDDISKVPEATGAVIVNDKVYVVMQHLGNSSGKWAVVRPGTIAVFKTSDNSFVKEIDLELYNPKNSMQVVGDKIYIPCTDNMMAGNGENGGIVVVDTKKDSVTKKIYKGHKVSNIAIVSDTKGYLVEYKGWGDNVIYSFNPSTGKVNSSKAVAGIEKRNIADIQISPDEKLWIADASTKDPGIYIVDTDDDSDDKGPLSTELNPSTIGFFE